MIKKNFWGEDVCKVYIYFKCAYGEEFYIKYQVFSMCKICTISMQVKTNICKLKKKFYHSSENIFVEFIYFSGIS